MSAIRRRLAIAVVAAAGLLCVGCFKTGEIEVSNSTDGSVLMLADANSCEPSTPSRYSRWVGIPPHETKKHFVFSGGWLGDSCLSVSTTDGSRVTTVKVERGRAYEVTEARQILAVQDVGEHDQPWYLTASDFDFSFSSWWFWYYVVPLALGAPVGIFITARFFYRFYVLKQE